MAYTLNIDTWDWVNPETQKVTRLRKGDEVPAEILNQDGIDIEEMTKGRNPQLLTKQEEARASVPTAATPKQQPRVENK